MRNRKHIRAAASAIALLAQFTFVSVNCLASISAETQYRVAGRWLGKFPLPDDNSLTDADNPVAVELTIKEDAGKLSGTAVFYVIRNKDGKPQIVGKKESELIAPQFDGKSLMFSVKSKGAQPGTEANIEMRMTLKSDTEAELESPHDSSAAVFQLKKMK